MIILARGECSKCGKSFKDFPEMITEQGASFYCKECERKYTLCPDCKSKTNVCEYCGGDLLSAWEFMEHKYGRKIMF